MKIGRRPDERHNAVILDLFGDLLEIEDRNVLLRALVRDEHIPTILLQLEGLGRVDDMSISMLESWARARQTRARRLRLVLVAPRPELRARLESWHKQSNVLCEFEIVENTTDAFKPSEAA